MLSVKQGGIKYHFLSLWYDSTWDWTPVFQTIANTLLIRPMAQKRKDKGIIITWRQHPTRHQLYGHLPPITKTIWVRRTRHADHCWRSKDELISDVLLWTPAYGRAKAGRPARTYIQQLCEDMGCSPEDLPEVMIIGRSSERGSRISMLAARHDDEDDDCLSSVASLI